MAGTVRKARLRHLRYRDLDGTVRGAEGSKGNPRLKRLEAWLAARAAVAASGGIGDTAAQTTFTAAASDICTAVAHGFVDGEGPCIVATAGTLPAGLVAGTLYFINEIDSGTFYLHLSQEDAVRDVRRVDITDAGTGAHTIERVADIPGLAEWLRREDVNSDKMAAATDIDAL